MCFSFIVRGITVRARSPRPRPYNYGPPGQPWSSFNLEAQGAIVDQWFGGKGKQTGNPMDRSSPYFGSYLSGCLRACE